MHWISTAIALLAALAAVLFALDAQRGARRCEMHANRLRAALGTIKGTESAVENFHTQLQKLRGVFYAHKAWAEDRVGSSHDELPPTPHGRELPTHTELFCPNYGQAQIEGPLSAAARCECGYCAEMRTRRDAFRRAKVPSTATAQAKLARINAGQGDGE